MVEATGGNYAVAQALLGHKSMTTTLNVYKKAITQGGFHAGMKLLEKVPEQVTKPDWVLSEMACGC